MFKVCIMKNKIILKTITNKNFTSSLIWKSLCKKKQVTYSLLKRVSASFLILLMYGILFASGNTGPLSRVVLAAWLVSIFYAAHYFFMHFLRAKREHSELVKKILRKEIY